MARTITARRLIAGDDVVDNPLMTLAEDGTVAAIERRAADTSGSDGTLAAAYFDIHTHGAVGHDVMSASPREFAAMQRFMAAHGVAHYLPTTVTASVDTTLRALERMADAIEAEPRAGEAQPVGIHLEGPFLSHAKRGVHPAHELQEPSVALFDRLMEAARGHMVLMTIAPDLPGAVELIAYAASRGVRVSLGHTNATASQALQGVQGGACSATHTFNAMRALDHREPGVLGVVLTDDGLFAELICDGVHVAPEMVRLWWRMKGRERAILVTDAMPAAGMPDGAYTLGGLAVTVAGGRALLRDDLAQGKETLAGSLLTMDSAVANLHAFTGASVDDGAHAASVTPAAMLGRPDLTRIVPGLPANLVRLDSGGRLMEAWVRGERVPRDAR